MLRSTFVIFICGWITWFMLDKPGAGQFRFPEDSEDLVANFQSAFDMFKAGYPKMAYIFIWKLHYIVLSLLCGALVAVVIGAVSDHLGRRRMRKLVLPGAVKKAPGPVPTPANHDTSG